ncbi:hypothetical protein SCUCBS95973_004113 [Sporothrix curviconia]|uniref:Carboxylesterase type B domain-containing protein n=1 Tax=Sporothrix curviconia TaxID=1260050 RepID=A0ABP0BKZ8_9PEZI
MPQHTVAVTGGLIQGMASPIDPAITLYKGIPYAAPPLGNNRWREPQPLVPWEGVKVCNTTGSICPQVAPNPRYMNILKGWPQSEDCLHLNLFQPAEGGEHERPWPVLVWIHGGGFREGGAADPNFDGTGLAQKGVVVVIPSFRLAAFGFFAHPDLTAESPNKASGNYGIYDNVQVLHWIQQNISAFCGDRARVTVSGQSAGATKTHTLLLSPLTKGLLPGAIIESGVRSPQEPVLEVGTPSYPSLKQAESEGVTVLEELGLPDIAALRAFPNVPRITELSLKRDTTRWGAPPLFRTVMDGHVLPRPYGDTLDQGPPNDVPVMTGQNLDEGGVYNEPRFDYDDLVASAYGRLGPDQAQSKNASEERVQRFLDIYTPADREPGRGPLAAWNLSARDNTRLNISLWAQKYHQNAKSPVFGYYFTHAPPDWHGWTAPDALATPKTPGFTNSNGPLTGAYHSAEFAYTFNSLITNNIRPWTGADRVLGDKLSTLWANFVRNGTPNGSGPADRPEGVREWPSLTENPDYLLELDGGFAVVPTVENPAAKAFWTEYIDSQPQV